jgi:hypothetical protein
LIIKNEQDLKNALLVECNKALKEISETIASQLTENIQEGVYNKAPSKYYKRTQEFIQSVIKPQVKISGSGITVTVGMDSMFMNATWNEGKLFNSHMSVDGNSNWGSNSVAEGLLSWWDAGTQNDVLPSVPATNYWYDVFGDRAGQDPNYKKLDDLISKTLNKYLKKFGVVIET